MVGIEGGGIVGPGGQAAVALYRRGTGAHTCMTHAQHTRELRIPVPLPFGKHAQPVAMAVVDVPEIVRPHGATGADGRPPVIQPVKKRLHAQTDGFVFAPHQTGLHGGAVGAGTGAHRHAGAIAVTVIAHVHAVTDALMPDTCLQIAPAELAPVSQPRHRCVVGRHVHALVGKTLKRQILPVHVGLQQMHTMAPCCTQLVVLYPKTAGSHFIGRDDTTTLAPRFRSLEDPAGAVILRAGPGALVIQMQ